MKVLKPGKKPDGKTIQSHCGHCEALLEFQQFECVPIEPDNPLNPYWKVECPECGSWVPVLP